MIFAYRIFNIVHQKQTPIRAFWTRNYAVLAFADSTNSCGLVTFGCDGLFENFPLVSLLQRGGKPQRCINLWPKNAARALYQAIKKR